MSQELVVSILLLLGVGFVLLAALGALRFQDALTRMAAISKASTLGLTLIFLAVITHAWTFSESMKAIITIVFLWLSTPIAAHLLGRAALLTHEKLNSKTEGTEFIDEMKSR